MIFKLVTRKNLLRSARCRRAREFDSALFLFRFRLVHGAALVFGKGGRFLRVSSLRGPQALFDQSLEGTFVALLSAAKTQRCND